MRSYRQFDDDPSQFIWTSAITLNGVERLERLVHGGCAMKATFKLNAETVCEVENAVGNFLNLTIRQGVWFDGNDNRRVTELCLSKSEARAIASALMGCAKEA